MPETPNQIQFACPQHGDAPWMHLTYQGQVRRLCAVCMFDVLTRMGVRGMFPVPVSAVEPEPVEWPEELLEVE